MQNTEEKIAEEIKRRSNGLIYISGYVNTHGKVYVKCKQCGNEFNANYLGIIQKGTQCPECKRRKGNERKLEKEKQKQAEKERKSKTRETEKQIRINEKHKKKCCICGKVFIAKHMGRITCSEECRKERNRKTKRMNPNKTNKDARIKGKQIDKDITLQKLFERDKGICYICGGECDIQDMGIYKDGKTIVCGDNYPSIDHIIPLSKGGVHSWENIKLAHRRCNYLKSDKQ